MKWGVIRGPKLVVTAAKIEQNRSFELNYSTTGSYSSKLTPAKTEKSAGLTSGYVSLRERQTLPKLHHFEIEEPAKPTSTYRVLVTQGC